MESRPHSEQPSTLLTVVSSVARPPRTLRLPAVESTISSGSTSSTCQLRATLDAAPRRATSPMLAQVTYQATGLKTGPAQSRPASLLVTRHRTASLRETIISDAFVISLARVQKTALVMVTRSPTCLMCLLPPLRKKRKSLTTHGRRSRSWKRSGPTLTTQKRSTRAPCIR